MQTFDDSVVINRNQLLKKTAALLMIWNYVTLKWRHYNLLT